MDERKHKMIKLATTDLENILKKEKITVNKIKPLYKDTGQKQVFFITINDKEYVCKVIDVTPYETYEKFELSTVQDIENLDEFELADATKEIEFRCGRINTEIKMSKTCSNLPQLVFFKELHYTRINTFWLAYYIEEKVEGDPLTYKQSYCFEEVIEFLLQMLNHIKIMYSNGYVHRDLKPNNIIVNHGKYFIIDGGLGKNLKEEEGNTRTTTSLGSYGYWAPEQQICTPNYNWNFQTDLYPLGIIAIEMVLPSLRKKFEILIDLHEVYDYWKKEYNDNKLMLDLFTKVIVKLSAKQKLDRFNNLDSAIETVKKIGEGVLG